jgi:hypothetical protein
MSIVSNGGNAAKQSSSEPQPSSHGTVARVSNRTPGFVVPPRPDLAKEGLATAPAASALSVGFRVLTLAIRTCRKTIRGAAGAAAVSIGFIAISFDGGTIATGLIVVKNKTRTLKMLCRFKPAYVAGLFNQAYGSFAVQ